jgi:hypothetical protein
MLYRAIFGIIPMILVAMFVSGAIPLGGLVPGPGTRSASEGGPARDLHEEAALGIERMAGVRPDQAITMEQEMRRAEAEAERSKAERRKRASRPDWAPSSGWGVAGR